MWARAAARAPHRQNTQMPLHYYEIMPIFEFHCPKCDESFEKLVRSETKVSCPKCSSARVERMISAPARPAGGAAAPRDYSALGPPQLKPKGPGGGCGGGGCGCH